MKRLSKTVQRVRNDIAGENWSQDRPLAAELVCHIFKPAELEAVVEFLWTKKDVSISGYCFKGSCQAISPKIKAKQKKCLRRIRG